MIGLSSYAGVMESLVNSAEEQQPSSPLVNSWSKKEDSSKNQKPKGVGGFVLVHAGKTHCINRIMVVLYKVFVL